MQPLTVQIDGMTCGHCVEEITETLKTLNGVHVRSVRSEAHGLLRPS